MWKIKKYINSKNSQISPEYIYFIAIIVVVALIYLSFSTDSLRFLSSESDTDVYWRSMQIGILKIEDTGVNTSIILLNNHRENITINDVKLSNRSLGISGEIEVGKAKEFVSLQTGFPYEVSIWMNYSLNDEILIFRVPSITFKGVQN